MEIRKVRPNDFSVLFEYWQNIGKKIPFFFPVSFNKWQTCLFQDELDGELMFEESEIYVVIDHEKIHGFVQGIQPAFAWNEKGGKYHSPQIGIIRHFYFDESQTEVADQLWDQIEPFINQFCQKHAFYHIFGMSCNAYHGKLHENFGHVESYLMGKGFEVEHENVYYELEMEKCAVGSPRGSLIAKASQGTSSQEYEIHAGGQLIGRLNVRFLDPLTGGKTKDTVYLTWIFINEEFRRMGWAGEAIRLLMRNLRDCGYRILHTDTAKENFAAQNFYEKLGFAHLGRTRSYIFDIGEPDGKRI